MKSHLNLRWTVADMDDIQRLANARIPLRTIAVTVGAEEREVKEVMERNGIRIAGDRQW